MLQKNDQRNLNVLPEPFASSDVSCEGIETDVIYNDCLLREKVILVGDENVGKTSLIESFLNSARRKNYVMTKGVEFKDVAEMQTSNPNITVDLFLYDVGGQTIFNQRQAQQRFYEHCTYIICVFDISSRKSLESVKNWVSSVRSASIILSGTPVILVGNKTDLREGSDAISEIDEDQGAKYAMHHGFKYFECCAETSCEVIAPFQYIANASADRYQKDVKN